MTSFDDYARKLEAADRAKYHAALERQSKAVTAVSGVSSLLGILAPTLDALAYGAMGGLALFAIFG